MPIYEYDGWSTTGFITSPEWITWNGNATTSSSTASWTMDMKWSWNMSTTRTLYTINNVNHRSAEIDAAHALDHAARRARSEARSAARVVARDRADELLLSILSPEQRATYQDSGEFLVVGSAGGLYVIRRGVSGNISWIDQDGNVGGVLCAHPTMRDGWMPDQDVAVSQLLALTTDEPAFVAVANVHRGSRPPIPVLA